MLPVTVRGDEYYVDCTCGRRHRLGIPTHLSGNVGEALRPGPIDTATASDLADMLDLHDEQLSVSWPAGMNAGSARVLLADYRASRSEASGMHGTATGSATLPGTVPECDTDTRSAEFFWRTIWSYGHW